MTVSGQSVESSLSPPVPSSTWGGRAPQTIARVARPVGSRALAACSPERQYRGRQGNAAARRHSEEVAMHTEPLVFVGIDWASTEHQVCFIGPGEPVQRAFAHDAGGIGAMVDWPC